MHHSNNRNCLKSFVKGICLILCIFPSLAYANYQGTCLDKNEHFKKCSVSLKEDSVKIRYGSGKILLIEGKDIAYVVLNPEVYKGEGAFTSTIVVGSTHFFVPIKRKNEKYLFLGFEYIEGYLDEDRPIKKAILMRLKKKLASELKEKLDTLKDKNKDPQVIEEIHT